MKIRLFCDMKHCQLIHIFYTDIYQPTRRLIPEDSNLYTECPTRYRTRHFFNNSKTNEDIATEQTHTTNTFLFISYTTNVLLFKFRCNILIGVRIIKEMPGSVASGTPCTTIRLSSFHIGRLFQADRLAAGLLQLGLSTGDRLGIWGPNSSEWYISRLAAARAGLVAVSICTLNL